MRQCVPSILALRCLSSCPSVTYASRPVVLFPRIVRRPLGRAKSGLFLNANLVWFDPSALGWGELGPPLPDAATNRCEQPVRAPCARYSRLGHDLESLV